MRTGSVCGLAFSLSFSFTIWTYGVAFPFHEHTIVAFFPLEVCPSSAERSPSTQHWSNLWNPVSWTRKRIEVALGKSRTFWGFFHVHAYRQAWQLATNKQWSAYGGMPAMAFRDAPGDVNSSAQVLCSEANRLTRQRHLSSALLGCYASALKHVAVHGPWITLIAIQPANWRGTPAHRRGQDKLLRPAGGAAGIGKACLTRALAGWPWRRLMDRSVSQ